MPLDKNRVPISIAQGLDTKSDPKQIQAGKFTTLENAVFLKTGQISKRNGFKYYSWFGGNGDTCGTLKDKLLVLGENEAYSFVPGSITYAGYRGRYSRFKVSKGDGINNSVRACTAYDSTNKVLIHAWEEPDGSGNTLVKWAVVDAATNSVIYQSPDFSEGVSPQVVTSPNMDYFIIIWAVPSASFDLRGFAVKKSDYNSASFFYLATGAAYSNYGFRLYAKDYPYVSWSAGAAAADTKIAVFSNTYASFAVPTPVTLSGTSCKYGSAIEQYGSDVMFAFNDGTDIKTIVYNYNLTSTVSALRTAMTASGGTSFSGVQLSTRQDNDFPIKVFVFTTTLTGTGLTQLPKVEQCIVTGSSTITAKRNFVLGAGLAGNSFYFGAASNFIDRKQYIPIKCIQQFVPGASSGYSGLYTIYFIEIYNSNYFNTAPPNSYVAAKIYDLNATAISPNAGHPDYIYFSPDQINTYATVVYGLIPEYAGNSSLCTVSQTVKPVMAELGNNLHVTGGYLGMFDGFEFAEHNFFQTPLQVALTNAGAGSVPAGTYYYAITYEWQDASGQDHISAPSSPVSITLAGASTVTVTASTLKLTNKTTNVYIGVYRSNDGILYYKLPNTGFGTPVISVKSSTTISITDNNTQTSLLSRPLLYTSGGELDNASAPACTFVGSYKRRLIVVPSEDSNSFWFSKDIIPATSGSIGTPVSFATEFVKSVDERGGRVTGTYQLDDKLVIFKDNTISVMVGEGPAPNGFNDDFTTPQLIASDTGCLYGRSIVLMPLGLMFQSPKGFYLCDRSLSVSYIGAPIETYNTTECISANLLHDRNEVWFGLNNNKIAVYNYYFNQFSTLNLQSLHGTIYRDKYFGVSFGFSFIEQPGLYYDTNSSNVNSGFAMKATTGWLSFAQVQGFQRVYKLMLLGDYKSAHRLQVQVSVDFDDTVVQTSTITATSSLPYQYRVFLTRQKCEAIKFTIQDLAPTSGAWTEAFTLGNMAFEVGIKKGLNKLPASKSAG